MRLSTLWTSLDSGTATVYEYIAQCDVAAGGAADCSFSPFRRIRRRRGLVAGELTEGGALVGRWIGGGYVDWGEGSSSVSFEPIAPKPEPLVYAYVAVPDDRQAGGSGVCSTRAAFAVLASVGSRRGRQRSKCAVVAVRTVRAYTAVPGMVRDRAVPTATSVRVVMTYKAMPGIGSVAEISSETYAVLDLAGQIAYEDALFGLVDLEAA